MACDDLCASCVTLSSQCTVCVTNYYLFGSSCYLVCPNGYFNNVVTGKNVCTQCASTCATCVTLSTSCLTCNLNAATGLV